MKICHIALYTKDLDALINFYERYFGGKPGGIYHNRARGFRSCFLEFGGGPSLEIMALEHGLKPGHPEDGREGYSHVAFALGSPEEVNALTEILSADGFKIVSGPRTTGDGYYESCVLDPDGNRVEITC